MVDGVPIVTRYDYDAAGNLTKEIDANGHATSYTYDSNRQPSHPDTTRTTSSGLQTLTTTYAYDRLGHLLRTTYPDGTSTRTVYDAMGRQKETFDKLDHRTSYDYDDMGRLVLTTYPDLTTEEATYDDEGRRLTSKDRASRRHRIYVRRTWAASSERPIPIRRSSRTPTTVRAGSIAIQDARGKTTIVRLRQRGPSHFGQGSAEHGRVRGDGRHLRRQRQPEDGARREPAHHDLYEYDEQNRRTKTIFPDAQLHGDDLRQPRAPEIGEGSGRQGDAVRVRPAGAPDQGHRRPQRARRRTRTTRSAIASAKPTRTDHTTSFEYDRLGRETKRILPGGAFETKTYDAAGSLRTRTDFKGRTTTYGYDVNNRADVADVRRCRTQVPVSFTYTPTGRRKTATVGMSTTCTGTTCVIG